MDDEQALSAFVAEAHRNGYATAQPQVDDDGRKVLTYERENWRYRDVYYGSEAFGGHEVVSCQSDPRWGMHYYGDLTTEDADRDETYSFLRAALERASEDRPYRGPERFERDGLTYWSSVEGDLRRFEGEERIAADGATVYRGTFAGGRLD